MTENKIRLTIEGRAVEWDLDPSMAAIIAQDFVSVLGPAREVEA